MEVITSTLMEDKTLTDNLDLFGTIMGDVIVPAPFKMEVKGRIQGNVTIEKGATVVVEGAIIGDVKNAGCLEIFGVFRGEIEDCGGKTIVDDSAMML